MGNAFGAWNVRGNEPANDAHSALVTAKGVFFIARKVRSVAHLTVRKSPRG